MKFSLQKLALAVTLLLVSMQSESVFAQNYPAPGKSTAAPVICTGCKDNNASGQPNDGLKTWPYGPPLVNHTGRILDANFIVNFQYPPRTLRARRIRIARQQRGSAPPRAYVQLGSSIGVYSLNTFFSSTLPAGPFPLKGATRPGYPAEKVASYDGFVCPECTSTWDTPNADGQDRLFDFSFDDRGYLYIAAGFFGWGIVRDSGETGGVQLPLVSQTIPDSIIDDPRMIVAFKSGSKYYVVVSDDTSAKGRHVWDVTNPASPVGGYAKIDPDAAFMSWAKDDVNGRIAIVTALSKRIEIYDYANFVSGGGPVETYTGGGSKKFKDVTVDENGNFWTSEVTGTLSTNNLIKFERTGNTYTKRSFNVYGGPFTPDDVASESANTIEYGDKYLTVVGRTTGFAYDAKLFKIEGGEPIAVNLNSFFKNYYWSPPRDYAMPSGCTVPFGMYPIKWNNKTYLINSTNGLADVFELQGGDSITGSLKPGNHGTANPNSKSTEAGPYYADMMKFRAESSNPVAAYNVLWDFDNTDSGADNEASARTGEDVSHQFTGLNNVAKINTTRQVKVKAPVNADMTDTVSVSLKVPTARIGIGGTNTVVTANNSSIDLVAGDLLADASDGNVEGHYSSWTIDGITTKQAPNLTIAAGVVGPHTVSLAASYGKYDASFNTVGSPFVVGVSNVNVTVRPFVVAFGNVSKSGSTVTFKGTARKASSAVLLATNWTVEWSLKNGASDVVTPTSASVPVGQIPDFPVTVAIPSGSILKLKVSVDAGGVIPGAINYISHEVTQTLITPDPKITKSGCLNAGEACTFTAGSIGGNPITGWTITWTLKKNGTAVGNFSGNPYSPSISEPGDYSVTVVAATSVFSDDADLAFTVAGVICGEPPTETEMSVFASCTSNCATNTDITFRADPFHYVPQGCEEYLWNFGDGQTATVNTISTKHKYTSNGSKTVRLKVKKGTKVSVEFTKTITIGADEQQPTCTFPSNIDFSWFGNGGCGPTTNCKVGESVKFTGIRGVTGPLQTCDVANWTFPDGTTITKSPTRSFSAPGTYNVSLIVSNTVGTSALVTKTLTIVPGQTDNSCVAPSEANIVISYRGRQSSCTKTSSQTCTRGEIIDFKAELFPLNNPKTCDKFEWNFGDGSALAATQNAEHAYSASGTAATYPISFRWHNTQGSLPLSLTVRFAETPVIPPPVLTYTFFPTTGAKGDTITFAAESNMDTTTGWTWTFSDGTPAVTPQGISRTSTVTHTFANSGTFNVKVAARNSTDTSTLPPQGSVQRSITLADVIKFKYLLPAVGHSGPWKSDVQIYTSDAVSATTPLKMTARYEGTDYPLSIPSSTYIYEDFLKASLGRDGAGPVVITTENAKVPPQIWTRTYNQTGNGTFGQFIPAIRIDSAGAGAAFGEGNYYLAGLRADTRYRTNIGLVNPNPTTINAIITTYDDEGLQLGTFTRQLNTFQLDQFNIGVHPDAKINSARPFSVQIEVPPGQWLYAYASLIDGRSEDPVFLQAVRESELTPEDYRTIMIPGVGHFNTWRSDVTIFNPPGKKIPVDLAYYDQGGNLVAEAKGVPVGAGEFLQYDDLLKQGVLGSLSDSFGLLRITVPASVSTTRFPTAFSRTYSDDGAGKTYGQGIGGFAVARANVKSTKAGLIPGIRSDASYRTDLGITNVTDQAAVATVRYLDPFTGVEFRSQQFALKAYESVKATDVSLDGRTRASVKVEVVGGNVWAYASVIDRLTLDPEYVQAMPLP